MFRLNKEITKKINENGKDSSEQSNSSSKANEQNIYNEVLYDEKYWKNFTNKQTPESFYTKYDSHKDNKYANTLIHNEQNDDSCDDDVLDEEEKPSINQVSSINVKHIHFGNHIKQDHQNILNTSKGNNTSGNNNKFIKCVTEPDEYFITRPYFSFLNITPTKNNQFNYNMCTNSNNNSHTNQFHQGIPSFNSAQQQMNNFGYYMNMNILQNNNNASVSNTHNSKGSFVSTQYSSNKNYHNKLSSNEEVCFDFEDSTDENTFTNPKYITDYRAKIPTNESIESNQSNKNKQPPTQQHNRMFTDNNNFINIFKPAHNYYNSTRMNNTNNNNNNNMSIKPPYTKNDNMNSNRSDKQPINLDNVSYNIISFLFLTLL